LIFRNSLQESLFYFTVEVKLLVVAQWKELIAENKKGTFDINYQKSLFCGLQVQPFEPIFKGFGGNSFNS
jgi:hypothetical protein